MFKEGTRTNKWTIISKACANIFDTGRRITLASVHFLSHEATSATTPPRALQLEHRRKNRPIHSTMSRAI